MMFQEEFLFGFTTIITLFMVVVGLMVLLAKVNKLDVVVKIFEPVFWGSLILSLLSMMVVIVFYI